MHTSDDFWLVFYLRFEIRERVCVSENLYVCSRNAAQSQHPDNIFGKQVYFCLFWPFVHPQPWPDVNVANMEAEGERENESVESYINLMDVCTTKHHNQFCSKWKRSLTETHKYQYTLSRSIYVRISLQLSTVLDLLLCCCHLTWKFVIDFRFLISLLCEETGLRVNDHR